MGKNSFYQEFENKGHLLHNLKAMGASNEEMKTVENGLPEWQSRPGPVVRDGGQRAWEEVFYGDGEVTREAKEVIEKYLK